MDDVDAARQHFSPLRRTAILIAVVTSASLFITTVMVVSAILPQLQGAMSATSDEIAWTMTFNILATAVAMPLTGWLVGRFGQRAVMLGTVFGFTSATFFCGASDTLEALVFWRIMQGALGAPLLPLAQAILLDIFPKRLHNMATAIYGMAIVLGPILGPGIGGYLAEAYSWRWSFYMILPAGFLAFIGLQLTMPKNNPSDASDVRFDWIGFLALSASISCIQLVLSRGQRLDWYDSGEIIIETAIGLIAFYIFIVHSLTARAPFLNLKLLLNKDYTLGLILVSIFGMLNWTPMVLLPTLLQTYAGFPDALIGYVVSSRGIGAMAGFFAAMFMGWISPRINMTIGFAAQVWSGIWLMSLDLNVEVWVLVANGILQGFSVGIIWVPLTVVTFSGLNPRVLPEATAVFHLLRNIGASLFISVCVAEVVRSTGMNYSHMAESITAFNEVLTMPWAVGGWDTETLEGLARISKEMTRQSAMIGYLNAFGLYTLISVIAIPAVLATAIRRRPAKA